MKWVQHRNGQQSTKLSWGPIKTRGRVWQDVGKRWNASVHGQMLTNPDAIEGPGDYGFLAVYDWGSEAAAKEAVVRFVLTP